MLVYMLHSKLKCFGFGFVSFGSSLGFDHLVSVLVALL